MRALLSILVCFIFLVVSCTKDKFVTGKNAFLITSDTAVYFDTVFTSVGSVTKQLKLFNINEKKLRLDNVELAGGANSFFKMNVSGTPGTQFSNIEMDKGDSLYIFISVNINPSQQHLPFIIEDSIRIDYNGNTQFIKLSAYGQNARFLRNAIITQNTTWTNDLPYVLMDSFAVSKGATLTIGKGVQVYCHANTPVTIEGSLQANGTADSTGKIVFQNDRLDAPYRDEPGTWQGIYFMPESKNNVLNFVLLKNALQGIAADEGSSVILNECRISNCAGEGIIAYHSNVTATNCLIDNCSYNVYSLAGGNYHFKNCTIAAYNSQYLFHQFPAVTLANTNENGIASYALQAVFENCIIYGDEGLVTDEVAVVNNSAADYTVILQNTLYRSPAENPSVTYSDCLLNVDPQFKKIDKENKQFDFHITASSPCIDAGKKPGVAIDFDGNLRNEIPDIGCYELR